MPRDFSDDGLESLDFFVCKNRQEMVLCIAGRGYGRSETIQLLTPNHGGYEYIIVSNQYNYNSIYNISPL